jgi:uncharacterized membrane protein YeaQ/YmgE (transglycosylase-associated protein family)
MLYFILKFKLTTEVDMSFIAWIILGLVACSIASKLVNKTVEGFFLDIVLGIVGAVACGWLFSLFGMHKVIQTKENHPDE